MTDLLPHNDAHRLKKMLLLYEEFRSCTHPEIEALFEESTEAIRQRFLHHIELIDISPRTTIVLHCASDRLAPGQRVGEVQIQRKLTHGGMGEIYLGSMRDETSGSGKLIAVAVKVLKERVSEKRMEKEISSLKMLKEIPGIVRLYDVEFLEDGSHCAIMELIQSGSDQICSVHDLLEYRRMIKDSDDSIAFDRTSAATCSSRLPKELKPEFIAKWLVIVARALASAHESGVIHRDIKPGNLLLKSADDGFDIVLADFGLSKIATNGCMSPFTDGFEGTLLYAAPEVRNQSPNVKLDHRIDIYSFGLVMREMLTLEQPLIPESDTLRGEGLGKLEFLIGRCLEVDPELRIGSFSEIVVELERIGNWWPNMFWQLRIKNSPLRTRALLVSKFLLAICAISVILYSTWVLSPEKIRNRHDGTGDASPQLPSTLGNPVDSVPETPASTQNAVPVTPASTQNAVPVTPASTQNAVPVTPRTNPTSPASKAAGNPTSPASKPIGNPSAPATNNAPPSAPATNNTPPTAPASPLTSPTSPASKSGGGPTSPASKPGGGPTSPASKPSGGPTSPASNASMQKIAVPEQQSP